MYKFILAILMLSVISIASADQTEQVITLKDGSEIKGVLAGIDNGVYTVKTPIIGDVHVAASDVASITNGAGSGIAPMPNMDQQIADQQQKLMSNPDSMATLKEMMADPEIM